MSLKAGTAAHRWPEAGAGLLFRGVEVAQRRTADIEDTMSDATTPDTSGEFDAGFDEQYEHTEIDLLFVQDDGVPYDLKRGRHEWTLEMDTALDRGPEHQVEVIAHFHTFTIYYDIVPSFVEEIDDTKGILQVVMSKGGTVITLMSTIASAFPGGLQFKQNGLVWRRSYP